MNVVLITWGSALEGGAVEALTLARRVAEEGGARLRWLVIGEAAAQAAEVAGSYGVAGLDVIAEAKATGGNDALVAAMQQYCAETGPALVLFNQSAAARAVAPLLAGRLDAPVVMNAISIARDGGAIDITATAYGGDTHVVYRVDAPLCVISVVTTALIAEPAAQPTQPVRRDIAVDLSAVTERFAVVSAPKCEGPRLEDAEIIVSGGRGLGNAQNFDLVKELADVLGGMWGGSRVIVDEGWIDSSRQVGLTGKITRPGLYVAAGISGASQHMAGCSAAKTIVAINKDKDAPIFRYARYGIVGDCLEVLPELIKSARV